VVVVVVVVVVVFVSVVMVVVFRSSPRSSGVMAAFGRLIVEYCDEHLRTLTTRNESVFIPSSYSAFVKMADVRRPPTTIPTPDDPNPTPDTPSPTFDYQRGVYVPVVKDLFWKRNSAMINSFSKVFKLETVDHTSLESEEGWHVFIMSPRQPIKMARGGYFSLSFSVLLPEHVLPSAQFLRSCLTCTSNTHP